LLHQEAGPEGSMSANVDAPEEDNLCHVS
jgi:hypothetical protein